MGIPEPPKDKLINLTLSYFILTPYSGLVGKLKLIYRIMEKNKKSTIILITVAVVAFIAIIISVFAMDIFDALLDKIEYLEDSIDDLETEILSN